MALTTLVLVLIGLFGGTRAKQTDVTVKSEVGTFVGFREEVQLGDRNVSMSKFLGIPFAEPPLGDLRFRKPVPKAPLTEPYTTQKFGPACLQLYALSMNHSGDSEDCLYLNVFKPDTAGEDEKLPVMLWIYGGGFIMGSSDPYIGDALAANGPVIVVTFNYRVWAWGFLSTGDDNAPGNYGFWDQHFAIKWVHQNIAAFGGDPDKITIFGESAGSACTLFQGLYPGNTGLFQRIIAQSGTPAGQWAIQPNPAPDAWQLASLVGCETEDMSKMADCLRKAPVERLNASLNEMQHWTLRPPLPFGPIIDGELVQFLPSDTLDLNGKTEQQVKARQQLASYDLLIGLNSGEGASSINPMFGIYEKPENFLPNKTTFDKVIVPFLVNMLFGDDSPQVLKDLVISEYTDWNDPENPHSIRELVADMQGDSMFLSNIYRTIETHAVLSSQVTYMYYFTLLPYKSMSPRPSWFNKPLHADDLQFVFGNLIDIEVPGIIEKRDFQAWEKAASENIMTLWTNFAKTGNPNKPRDIGVDWLQYTSQRHRYLEITADVTSSKVKERLNERRAQLWDRILPAVAESVKCAKSVYDRTCTKY